jgi:hypothetical protein
MGGFQVSIEDIFPGPGTRRENFDNIPSIIPLSPSGVVQLAKLDHFIALPGSKIDDKSKANVVQKTLVLIQISWMIVQCCFRVANNAPIALLEIRK